MDIRLRFAGPWPVLLLLAFFAAPAVASPFKVLVVMSYEEDNPWCREIREGIDSVLGDNSDITYFYMDTKVRFDSGEARASEAYALFRLLEPDGVITADDNAQWMFVLPYLYGKVDTPVMFCGVNAEAEKYGFPSAHVSGSLERGHIRESIAFTKQLQPDLASVCFLVKDSPSGTALQRQVDSEQSDYLATVGGFFLVRTTAEIRALGPRLNSDCDAVYLDSLEGIT
ncbi:MAG: ABC transporter substrate-binding protein, partial [Gammaproteobacteria bacterium]|nr:ABC transporter substrate-binding protein [Gammaproteobacteria bacterium]